MRALWIEQQRDIAVRCRQVLDVVGQYGVEIADAVGPGERKIAAVIFVDQGRRICAHTNIRAANRRNRRAERTRNQTPIFCAGLLVQRRERRVDDSCGFGGLHDLRRLPPLQCSKGLFLPTLL